MIQNTLFNRKLGWIHFSSNLFFFLSDKSKANKDVKTKSRLINIDKKYLLMNCERLSFINQPASNKDPVSNLINKLIN